MADDVHEYEVAFVLSPLFSRCLSALSVASSSVIFQAREWHYVSKNQCGGFRRLRVIPRLKPFQTLSLCKDKFKGVGHWKSAKSPGHTRRARGVAETSTVVSRSYLTPYSSGKLHLVLLLSPLYSVQPEPPVIIIIR